MACNCCGLAELVFENVVFKHPLVLFWPLQIGLELATRMGRKGVCVPLLETTTERHTTLADEGGTIMSHD
jgi:hypothetical protein